MTGNRSKLKNFVEKFIGSVRFGNDHLGAIMGYGDYVIGTDNLKRCWHISSNVYFENSSTNGIVERRNRTLVEATRTMMIFSKAPMFLWAEAVATACYNQNRSLIHTHHNKTPYELVHDKKPDLTFLRVFGALCYPTNDSEDLGKFQAKADFGIFVGYAPSRKGYRIYNKRTHRLMETIHVTFDECFVEWLLAGDVISTNLDETMNFSSQEPKQVLSRLTSDMSIIQSTSKIDDEPTLEDPQSIRSSTSFNNLHITLFTGDPNPDNYPQIILEDNKISSDNIVGNLSSFEPKNFKMAVIEDCWFQAMQDEIHEFDRLEYTDRAIRIFIANAATKNIIIFQMDVKTAFSNGDLKKKSLSVSLKDLKTRIILRIFINQAKYALETLKKYGMDLSNPVDTPMVDRLKLERGSHGDSQLTKLNLEECLCNAEHSGMSKSSRRSTSVSAQFLEIDWLDVIKEAKKHTISQLQGWNTSPCPGVVLKNPLDADHSFKTTDLTSIKFSIL
ncbi:retrovirus-related pol polyprotein from transposon TNT 1-94 [Tanacetum coccineum]